MSQPQETGVGNEGKQVPSECQVCDVPAKREKERRVELDTFATCSDFLASLLKISTKYLPQTTNRVVSGKLFFLCLFFLSHLMEEVTIL